jgi:hypothetical protein
MWLTLYKYVESISAQDCDERALSSGQVLLPGRWLFVTLSDAPQGHDVLNDHAAVAGANRSGGAQ